MWLLLSCVNACVAKCITFGIWFASFIEFQCNGSEWQCNFFQSVHFFKQANVWGKNLNESMFRRLIYLIFGDMIFTSNIGIVEHSSKHSSIRWFCFNVYFIYKKDTFCVFDWTTFFIISFFYNFIFISKYFFFHFQLSFFIYFNVFHFIWILFYLFQISFIWNLNFFLFNWNSLLLLVLFLLFCLICKRIFIIFRNKLKLDWFARSKRTISFFSFHFCYIILFYFIPNISLIFFKKSQKRFSNWSTRLSKCNWLNERCKCNQECIDYKQR